MPRILDIADGFSSASEPTKGELEATSIVSYADDAAFVAGKGSAAAQGDVYFNTTYNLLRYYSTAWENVDSKFEVYANDAAYVTAKGSAAEAGDQYYNTTDDVLRYYDADATAWTSIASIAGTQVLTNKDIDGGTASDTSRITIPKAGTSTLNGLTDKEGTVAYDTDLGALVVNDGADWVELGGGSGAGRINYAEGDNSDFETGTGDWATYDDGAVAAPVDGTGGSPTVVTISNETTDPLRGEGSLRISKSAADGQGEGTSLDMTIDKADIGNVVEISFDYVTSADYADGDVVVYVYDKDGTNLIQAVPVELMASTIQTKFKAYVQTTYNATKASADEYRVILHNATTNASAWTIDIDNFVYGPPQYNFGVPSTDWTDFTPTGTWTANTTYTGAWRRVGDTMECQVHLDLDGAPTSAGLGVDLPSGYTIDTTKCVGAAQYKKALGYAIIRDEGTANYTGTVNYTDTNTVSVNCALASGSYSQALQVSQIAPHTFANTDSIDIFFTVPISGWSTNVQFSDSGGDTRVLAFSGKRQTSQSLAAATDVTIDWDTIEYDTHSAMSSGVFTCPFSGKYSLKGSYLTDTEAWTLNQLVNIYIEKNGTKVYRSLWGAQVAASFPSMNSIAVDIECNAGDTLEFIINSEVATDTTAVDDLTWMTIHAIQGPSAIAANELVAAEYYLSAGTANNSFANGASEIIDYDTLVNDTHGSVTTGASWKFTAPSAGRYQVNAHFLWANTTNLTGTQLYLNKNGAQYACLHLSGSFQQPKGSQSLHLDAGDYIDIRAYQTDSGTSARAPDTASGTMFSRVSIIRQGF